MIAHRRKVVRFKLVQEKKTCIRQRGNMKNCSKAESTCESEFDFYQVIMTVMMSFLSWYYIDLKFSLLAVILEHCSVKI